MTATDGSGASDSASFSWTVTNTVSVTSPGDQSDLSGSAITPVDVAATDSSSTATLAYSATGLPDGLAIDPSTGTIIGNADHGRHVVGDRDRHRRCGRLGHGLVLVDDLGHPGSGQPRQPDG